MGYLAQVQSLHRVCDVSNNQSYNISQPIQLPLLEEFPGNPGPIKRRKKVIIWNSIGSDHIDRLVDQ
ncbi:unnamed protein product [Brugia pahangi]|uniref:Fe2OG dioxygenase domain-containing protein n=1 Tax=Brugia pahangi TaxID=6280 RepID=A0A0N4TY39_BRUPA|nr:unnamed protein product [Brugia pahangi]